MDWFRSWHGAPTDTKWLVIARRANVAPGIVSATAWALFDYASQAPDRGNVTGFDVEMYAVYSGFSEADISAVLAAMRDKAIINDAGRLSSWDKRQPKREDDSAERVARYREKQRSVTQGNAPVTQGNAPDTDTDQNREETECVFPAPADELRTYSGLTPGATPGLMPPPTHTQTAMEKPPYAFIDRTDDQKAILRLYQDTTAQVITSSEKRVAWLDDMTKSAGRARMESLIADLRLEIQAGRVLPYNALQWLSDSLRPMQGRNGKRPTPPPNISDMPDFGVTAT